MLYGINVLFIPFDWKKGVSCPYLKGQKEPGLQQLPRYNTVKIPDKVLAYLLLQKHSHLLEHQRHEQSGTAPGNSTSQILVLRVLVNR